MVLSILLVGTIISVILAGIIGMYSKHKILHTCLLAVMYLVSEYFTIGIYILSNFERH